MTFGPESHDVILECFHIVKKSSLHNTNHKAVQGEYICVVDLSFEFVRIQGTVGMDFFFSSAVQPGPVLC